MPSIDGRAVNGVSGATSGAQIGSSFGPYGAAAGAVIGGIMSMFGNAHERNEGEGFQREVLQNQLQWRVADAKRAGIHPLYALGMSPAIASPIALGNQMGDSLSQMGQHVGEALDRNSNTYERATRRLSLALLEKQGNESDARSMYYRSLAARMQNPPAAPNGLGIQNESGIGLEGQDAFVPGRPSSTGMIDLNPVPQASAKRGYPDVVAGSHPAGQEHIMRGGMPWMGPAVANESLDEVQSEINPAVTVGDVMRSALLYGGKHPDRWKDYLGDWFSSRFLGVPPTYQWKRLTEGGGTYPKDIPLSRPEDYRGYLPWWRFDIRQDMVNPFGQEMALLRQKYNENAQARYKALEGVKEKMIDSWNRFWHPTTYPAFPRRKRN